MKNNQIKLYIKCHNNSNLQYFGKTSQKLETYTGGGVYWNRHLKKHGYDVNTICMGTYNENDPMLIEHALGFSACNDIVNSNTWANLIPENGKDGGSNGPHSEETKRKISKLAKERYKNGTHILCSIENGYIMTEETKQKISNSHKGKTITEKTKQKISNSHKGKHRTEEHRKNLSISNKGQKRTEKTKKNIKDNHHLKMRYEIFNTNNILLFQFYSPFGEFCEKHKFPTSTFKHSYQTNSIIYENINYENKPNRLSEENLEKYKGWYVRANFCSFIT